MQGNVITNGNGVPRKLGAVDLTDKEQEVLLEMARSMVTARYTRLAGKMTFELDYSNNGGIVKSIQVISRFPLTAVL